MGHCAAGRPSQWCVDQRYAAHHSAPDRATLRGRGVGRALTISRLLYITHRLALAVRVGALTRQCGWGVRMRMAIRPALPVILCLCALLFCCASSSAQPTEARLALLIGNQAYNPAVGPLKNPHNDIALIGAALEKLGFKTTLIKDADYRAIDVAIKRHIQNVRREGPGTISFVYYSGHGAADPDTNINYLISVTVINAEDEGVWT